MHRSQSHFVPTSVWMQSEAARITQWVKLTQPEKNLVMSNLSAAIYMQAGQFFLQFPLSPIPPCRNSRSEPLLYHPLCSSGQLRCSHWHAATTGTMLFAQCNACNYFDMVEHFKIPWYFENHRLSTKSHFWLPLNSRIGGRGSSLFGQCPKENYFLPSLMFHMRWLGQHVEFMGVIL